MCGPEERDRPPCCEWHAPEGLQCDWHTAASGSAAETPAATPTAMRPLARSTSTNEAMRNALARSAERCRARGGVPVTVMLPLDCVDQTGLLKYASQRWFEHALASLKAVGCSGVMVDVWWGAVEREPRTYDWAPYRQLLEQVRRAGLRLQVVMAFHACGGNVNDTVNLPLPRWVLDAGDEDADIWYTDRAGNRNRECVSLFADEEARLDGRSPLQCYEDFMRSFGDAFQRDLQQGGAISEVLVGCGPCGELRYPSYPEALGWRFPGIGEFQCYDKRALASLAEAAEEYGEPEWGSAGPHDAGGYNARPHEAGFFAHGGWDSVRPSPARLHSHARARAFAPPPPSLRSSLPPFCFDEDTSMLAPDWSSPFYAGGRCRHCFASLVGVSEKHEHAREIARMRGPKGRAEASRLTPEPHSICRNTDASSRGGMATSSSRTPTA